MKKIKIYIYVVLKVFEVFYDGVCVMGFVNCGFYGWLLYLKLFWRDWKINVRLLDFWCLS